MPGSVVQLFILDENPRKAAICLCDKHLRKMCLENAQILSSVMFNWHLSRLPAMPKPYNPQHPVIKKIDNQAKLNWVLIYNLALHREYVYRFGKPHAYSALAPEYIRLLYRRGVAADDLSFALVFKDFSSASSDTVTAYRQYYCYKKRAMKDFSYTKRTQPAWLI